MLAVKLGPALATGNTLVMKVSEEFMSILFTYSFI
jgi:acyl-CoA reductase-like NAD-dependent aldehyde dehydrogenase